MRRYSVTLSIFSLTLLFCLASNGRVQAGEPINIWPDLAPGETTRLTGEALPRRPAEVPPVTRLINITRPTVSVFPAAEPNGTGLVILPGGGFGKVVPDKEGSEAAVWLNRHGVTAFVLNYRTTSGTDQPGWVRALQDAQRTLAVVRSNAARWSLEKDRIGLLGFSAGGQVAARLLSDDGKLSYDRVDTTDDVSHRPDFALLIYPWNITTRRTIRWSRALRSPRTVRPHSWCIRTTIDLRLWARCTFTRVSSATRYPRNCMSTVTAVTVMASATSRLHRFHRGPVMRNTGWERGAFSKSREVISVLASGLRKQADPNTDRNHGQRTDSLRCPTNFFPAGLPHIFGILHSGIEHEQA